MMHSIKRLGRPHRPTFRVHVHAHEEVINNEAWYGDGKPSPGKAFTAKRTAERQNKLIKILQRAANKAEKTGNPKLAQRYQNLIDKLDRCESNQRCGSLACLQCARAFQKATVRAENKLIKRLAKDPTRDLVFVTIIPTGMMFQPGTFAQLDMPKANRWLKDALKKAGIKNRTVFGSADLGWDSRRGSKYLQLHWHLGMWTTNPDKLQKKLKKIFKRAKKHERPVDVTVTWDLNFLPYLNKKIKVPDLLRRARRQLAELSLVLDRTDPLELIVLSELRLGAQDGRLRLNSIK
jgi:hypothetical protein